MRYIVAVGFPQLNEAWCPPVSVMQMLLPTLVNGEYSFDTAALDTDGVKLLQKWVQKYTNRGLPRHLARGGI